MRKICLLLTVLLIMSNVFAHSNHAYAQDLTQQLIKDIKVEKSDGSTGEFTHRERAKLSVEFGGAKVSPGDTINMGLPEELKGFNKNFDLKNEQGVSLGTCNVTLDSVKCTFNDNVKDIDNVRGSFFFEAEINKSTEGKNNVDLNFENTTIHKEIIVSNSTGSGGESDEIFYKNGQIEPEDTDHVQWTIRFNNKQDYFSPNSPAIIKDTLGPGQKLEEDKFQFAVRTKGQDEVQYYTKEEFENRGLGNVEINGNGFTVWFNNPTYNELLIYYSTEITDKNAASFNNNSSVTYTDKSGNQMSENSNATIQNINAGGKAEGDLQKFSGDLIISKIGVDSNGNTKPLEGAEFELVNIDGDVVGKGTTDASGKLIFKDIKGGTHKIKEIKVPDGYKIDKANFPNEIVLDFEVNKEINLEVTNVADTPPVDPSTEEPSTEEPSTEEPSTEEPSTEEPSTEEPSTEEPSTEEPSTEEPSTEEPSTEEPSTEEPSTEEPSTEEPSTEEPSTEEPSTEEPSTEEPSTEEPSTEEPSTEEPSTEEPSTEEPSTEEPSTEEPSTEEPSTEEPSTEEPSTEEPSTEEPSTEEPSTEEPSTEEPSTEEPSTEEPSTEEPSTEEPSTEEPSTEEPSTEEPSTEEPSTEEPSTEEPSTEEPSTEEPSTEEPSTEEPSTEEPSTEEPSTEEPSTEEPSTEEPSTEEPSTEEPSTEEPSTEEPSTEEPSTEEPSTEEPSTEEPSTEEPSTPGKPSAEKPGSPGKPSAEEPGSSGKPSQGKPNGDSNITNNGKQSTDQSQKGDKNNFLPNTGEAIQSHPIVTAVIIMILMVLGIALISFRRKN